MSRICIDLDGVIAKLRMPGQTYAEVEPVEGAAAKLVALKQAGHHLILFTARHMKTCEGNVGKVLARIGSITLQWLERHGIPYDEIHFGKPWADIYIDDNALRFEGWAGIADDGGNLPRSKEDQAVARP